LARDEYLEHLGAVPLFSGCTKAQLQEIARVADELTVPAGTVLARQGYTGSELFVIVDGTVTVTRDGKEVASVGRGGFVGELAVLARVPRNATIIAASDLDVLVLTPLGLSQLLDDIPGLAKQLLQEVVDRLVATSADHSE
jgi:CRP/FNR family transcriptional regulator, cyclic AMP receptor protein